MSSTRATMLAIALILAAVPAGAQWKNLPKDGVPMGPDGKPNMAAPAPRTASGRPDLSGIFMPSYRYFQNLAADLGLQNVPMTDEARKIERQAVARSRRPARERQAHRDRTIPAAKLRPLGDRHHHQRPDLYTKPWTATTNLRLMPDTELFEFICNENEKSSSHMGPHIK